MEDLLSQKLSTNFRMYKGLMISPVLQIEKTEAQRG